MYVLIYRSTFFSCEFHFGATRIALWSALLQAYYQEDDETLPIRMYDSSYEMFCALKIAPSILGKTLFL